MTNKLFQLIHDWYVTGPRVFYEKYVDRFFQRRNLVAVSGEHGFLDMDPLPLGYSTFPTLDDKMIEATRRRFDMVAERY